MITVKHKFRDFANNENIEILILGTFNPDAENNPADFFYGRSKNYLWNLLPKVFNNKGLKNESVKEKIEFMNAFKIGFADIIQEVIVECGSEANYADDYIDDKVSKWLDIESLLAQYKSLKCIYFTRKSFSDIPNMKRQIDNIVELTTKNNIKFSCLPTPARFENEDKLNEWKSIFK